MSTTVERQLTPTGVVVSHAEANSDEWYAQRDRGIGSSDIPPILGLSNYASAAHVWARKLGRIPRDEAGRAAQWGHLLEPVIAGEWARRHGTTVRTVPTLRHVEHPHHMAALDRLVDRCPDGAGDCALEVKFQSAWKAGSWRDDVPDAYLAQVSWQLHVTGLDHIHVVALLDQRDVDRIVVREAEVIDYTVREAESFWQHVLTETPPPVDSAAMLLDLLERLHPERSGAVEVDRTLVAEIRASYEAAHAEAKAAGERKDAAKAALLELLGGGEIATVDGIPVATYTSVTRTDVDRDRLRKAHPDVWDDVTSQSTSRRFTWKKATI